MTKFQSEPSMRSHPIQDGKRLYLWDSDIKGFGLLVLPSGVKSYFYRYRNQERVERRATIGKHGTWTPEQARRRAEEFRRILSPPAAIRCARSARSRQRRPSPRCSTPMSKASDSRCKSHMDADLRSRPHRRVT